MSTFNIQYEEMQDEKNHRVTLRLKTKERHDDIIAVAKKNRHSLNEEMLIAIDGHCDKELGREILNRLNQNK
jgi:hypothetical protein